MQTLIADQLIQDLGVDYFKEASTFGALPDNAIRYLLEQGEIIQLEKGDRLFQCGDPVDCFYIVLKGVIQFLSFHETEINYVRDFVFGEQIGFVAMTALQNRLGNAQAETDCIVLRVSSTVFFDLHEALPTEFGILLLNLSREMARQVVELVSTHTNGSHI